MLNRALSLPSTNRSMMIPSGTTVSWLEPVPKVSHRACFGELLDPMLRRQVLRPLDEFVIYPRLQLCDAGYFEGYLLAAIVDGPKIAIIGEGRVRIESSSNSDHVLSMMKV